MNRQTLKDNGFDGKVICIDDDVRSVIELYLAQFRNYEEAARAIGINRDTIVKYNTFSQSMAAYIFSRMVQYLQANVQPEQLLGILPAFDLGKVMEAAAPSDHAQKDHVMYRINDVIAAMLKKFVKPFPNIGAAGAALGINPRTFKAYLDGSIEAIPQRYFWRLLDGLKRQGSEEEELLKEAGIAAWTDMLEERRRTPTLNSDPSQLLQMILEQIREGKRQRKDFPRELVNACYRVFGSFGDAVKFSMKSYQADIRDKIHECLREGQVRRAHSLVAKLRQDFEAFDEVQRIIYKALPKRKRSSWSRELPRFKEIRRELNDLLENYEVDASRQYRMESHYQINDLIHHPGFGLGRVVKLEGKNRMVVDFFKRGMGQRVLIMNSGA